ncbi:ribonuclease domain-containing protein [Streptomyces sp. NPDC051366]|uniref:ribonuclease domain-containing protein n=1 Tax=unclassified Streptomyces TaxID=2593676 RepID=UPI0022506818|nr:MULTISPECIES: ribonuclease domain-containing protein [unclassified Streptomyces]MCX4625743.1 ribonuclease [Streptomyces sp. NBC_01443]
MRIPPRFVALAGAAAVAAALLTGPAASAAPAPASAPVSVAAAASAASVGSICYSALPSQAHHTLDLIDEGGPFPYSQDGVVFQNRERLLPIHGSGYYHEYTVVTPGSPTRGARRIITGQQWEEDYYTSDHYATFRRINFGC